MKKEKHVKENKVKSGNAKSMTIREKLKKAFLVSVTMGNVAAIVGVLALLYVNMRYSSGNATEILPTITWIVTGLIVVMIIAAGIVAMKFAAGAAKDIADPIAKIDGVLALLADGDLEHTVDLDSQDEFGEMAGNLDVAIAHLRTYVEVLQYGLSEIAEGNLTVRPTVEFKGDFVALKEAIEHIIISMNNTLGNINEGADNVSMGSEQLAQSAQGLAEGASTQAAAIEELIATVENVAAVTDESAKHAIEANKTAETFAAVADESNRDMNQLTEAMERITETSHEIETIIEEIEDIAEQTNLLSLNASIEAARAGEAGRGFAVVADQIGKLASDSAKSAANTRALIAKSLGEVEQGNEITLKTSEALVRVVDAIKLLAVASRESSEMSVEQSNTMQQVLKGIEQIAEVVQNNSAAAQETSATSEELAAQAQNLKASIEQFKLLD